MGRERLKILDDLVRAGALLAEEQQFKSLISVFVNQGMDISRSDLGALFLKKELASGLGNYALVCQRGRYEIPGRFTGSQAFEFMEEAGEAVVITEKVDSPFGDIFLSPEMKSAAAFPVKTPSEFLGVFVLNSKVRGYYNRERFNFLDSFTKLAGGMLHNAKLFQEMKEYLKKIEEMERYQENIFTSMTNLLLTVDKNGKIRYFNTTARKAMELHDDDIGKELRVLFKDKLGKKTLKLIEENKKQEVLGIEGIFKSVKDIDFSLNISPLKSKNGRNEGQTLLFTDQTRERALQQEMSKVVEERRLIKDMFSRYLSADLVQHLVDQPDLVRPFGAKKEATIFFADIRGYTSFSEGKDPEYIIEILNEYFQEAVEVVIRHQGFIDKFIGDCIMAAWGVPLQTVEEDAVNAVACAIEIQKLVDSTKRTFFKGKASKLKIGIGMHTGPLVAGNLGSVRRMDYTVIGDTVNIAARLEGVAKAGEVIITSETKKYLGDHFVLEKRDPVRVKGKARPLDIYAVLDQAS